MRIGIVNHSQILKEKTLEIASWASACHTQITRDVAPDWGRIPVAVTAFRKDEVIPADVFPIGLFDTSDEPGALGYHTNGYGRVFTTPILENGGTHSDGPNSISCTLSHEVIETDIDFYANFWADMTDGRETPIEPCDAVESNSYKVAGISVSNYLLPTWFDSESKETKFDKMELLTQPFSLARDGYWIVRDQGGNVTSVFGKWFRSKKKHPIAKKAALEFGPHFPEWKKELKLKSRRIQRRLGIAKP